VNDCYNDTIGQEESSEELSIQQTPLFVIEFPAILRGLIQVV
jgi:hypothetical protein